MRQAWRSGGQVGRTVVCVIQKKFFEVISNTITIDLEVSSAGLYFENVCNESCWGFAINPVDVGCLHE